MKKALLSLILGCISMFSFAQQDSSFLNTAPKFSFGFSPLSVFFSKVKLDFETGFQSKNPMLLSLSPVIYTGETYIYSNTRNIGPDNERTSNGDLVSGFGAEAQLKMARVIDADNLFMLYGGVGLGYHDISLKFTDFGWSTYREDGLEYYEYGIGDEKERIKRVDVFVNLGLRAYVNRRIYFDLSAGFVYQNSTITTTQSFSRPHRSGILDFGNQGANLRGNFAVGFSIF
ncbi:MAG: hypothetical protein V4616_03765 [Bacteroidota bacterium]